MTAGKTATGLFLTGQCESSAGWGKTCQQALDGVPPHMIMEVDTLVDATLAGQDIGGNVTIASLENVERWQAYDAARATLIPDLSLNPSASRTY